MKPKWMHWLDAVWYAFLVVVVTHGAIEAIRQGRDWRAALFIFGALIGINRTWGAIERVEATS